MYLMLLILISFSIAPTKTNVFASDYKYARAVNGNVNVYKLSTANDSIDNVLCIVEKTYFVEILSETADDYKVNYNGIIGYVKKNDVVLVSGTPSTPFPVGINLVLGSNCNLRSTPTTKSASSNVISTLSKNESDITFIGRVFAEEVIDFGGNTWYFVICNGEKGYIYNKYIKSVSPIYPNTEEISLYKSSEFTSLNPISEPNCVIIIMLLFIPCVAILIILYYPFKRFTRNTNRTCTKEIERY